MKTANPALNKNTFAKYMNREAYGHEAMSIDGTINKTFILFLLVIFTAAFSWLNLGAPYLPVLMIGSLIGGLIFAIITIFKKEWSPFTAPVYALFEGFFLGALSGFLNSVYPGIVIQAVGLTFGVLFVMLFLYKTKIIKVTEKFRMGIFAATGAVALIYLVSILLGFFGISVPLIYDNGLVGIIFSLVVVGIAAMNLVLDFDFIDRGANEKVPKFMEWYAAFGLMVTLIWLYIELLRLLSKLYSRR